MLWKVLIYLSMVAVIILAFTTASPMSSISTAGRPEIYRIFYFHVPQACVASIAFLMALFFSIRYLQTKRIEYDLKAVTACRLGFIFSILATISGSVFARMTWGEFWNWSEIREVSIFILLLIYGGYFAFRSAVSDEQTRAAFSAVLSILFGVAAVFLIFVLPRIYSVFSLHPKDSIVNSSGITMGPTVASIFALSLLSFTALFVWIYKISIEIYTSARFRAGER
jgi:heme exporter protein C